MSEKPPYICEPLDISSGRPATFIFLHGYADDAEGLPLGLAQQFQWNSKLPYLQWVLPNAPVHAEARERAWYMPKALPSALKPRVPGHDDLGEEDQAHDSDDEKGIMESVARVDQLVQAKIDEGVDPGRIIVGGFSQGCAVSLVWGLTGKLKDKVAGVVCASGYFPLAQRIAALRQERGLPAAPDHEFNEGNNGNDSGVKIKEWLYLYGGRDLLVPSRYFQHGLEELKKWIKEDNIEIHRYEAMGHGTCNAELRDMLYWFEKLIPA